MTINAKWGGKKEREGGMREGRLGSSMCVYLLSRTPFYDLKSETTRVQSELINAVSAHYRILVDQQLQAISSR